MSDPITSNVQNIPVPAGAATSGVTVPGTPITLLAGKTYQIRGGITIVATLNWGEMQANLNIVNPSMDNSDDPDAVNVASSSGWNYGVSAQGQNTFGPNTGGFDAIVPVQNGPVAEGEDMIGTVGGAVTIGTADIALGWALWFETAGSFDPSAPAPNIVCAWLSATDITPA